MAFMHSKQKSAHAQQSSKSIRIVNSIGQEKKRRCNINIAPCFGDNETRRDDASSLSLRKTRQFVSKCKSLVVATVKYRVLPIS